ncbi:MAG: sulfotransferase family protein [Candidatus Nanopelagicaceae bacterium]
MRSQTLPIFSGGTGRSGTTIIGKLLSQHPEIRGGKPYEVRFINDRFGLLDLCYGVENFERRWKQTFSQIYLNLLSPRKRTIFFKQFESNFRGKWWLRENRIGEASGLHRSISEQEREELLLTFKKQFPRDHIQASRNFFFDFLYYQRHNRGEQIWIDTTPLNISVADRIYLLLPEAKFIHMKRDGRDTVASVLKEKWGPKTPTSAMRWWIRRMNISMEALRSVPKDQVLELDLEKLVVTDREKSYRQLLEFVGVDDVPQMRKYFEVEMPAERVRIGKYRDEIPTWKDLDKLYFNALEKLN